MDLTLNSHFEAVIPESYRTKVRFMSKFTFWGQQKVSKKVQKGPPAPTPICWVNKKIGARRLDMKIGGVKKSSSFIWTLVVKKENGKGDPLYAPTDSIK